jgi:restriction system protein
VVLLAALVLAVLAGVGWLYNRQQQARWDAVRAQGLRYGLHELDALHHAKFEEAVRDRCAGTVAGTRSGSAAEATWART